MGVSISCENWWKGLPLNFGPDPSRQWFDLMGAGGAIDLIFIATEGKPQHFMWGLPAYFDKPPFTTLPKQTCESYFRKICFSSEAKHFHIK